MRMANIIGLVGVALSVLGCASDDDTVTTGRAGSAGTAGTAGTVDTVGAAGTAGATGTVDTAGAAGTAGATGTVDTAGAAGTAGATGTAAHVDCADPSGVYEDDYGFSQRIDNTTWSSVSAVFTFVAFDSMLDTAVAQNAETNQFNPGKFSRFDWATDESGQLRYCQTRYDAATTAEAAATPRADERDWGKGCGGFAWSVLNGPAILGTYIDDWGGTYAITGQSWTITGAPRSVFELLVLSNTNRYLVAKNAASNEYSPGKFSRFDWARDQAGLLYYCQTKYDAATVAEALAAPAADSSDLSKGCGAFSWSKLTPAAP
jgi:hypothetical protein